jgi:hypothetical protein
MFNRTYILLTGTESKEELVYTDCSSTQRLRDAERFRGLLR